MAEVFLAGSKPLRFLSHFVLGVEFFSQKFGVILCFGERLFIKAFWTFGIEFSPPSKSFEDPFHPSRDWQSCLLHPLSLPEQLKIAKSFLDCYYDFRCSVTKTHLTMENPRFDRNFIFIHGGFSMLVIQITIESRVVNSCYRVATKTS